MEDEESSPRNVIFGKDLSKVPCFRTSFLYSIASGVGGGLTYFLFTSNTKKSFHASFATYAVAWIGVYTYCMHNYASEKLKIKLINERIKEMRTKNTPS